MKKYIYSLFLCFIVASASAQHATWQQIVGLETIVTEQEYEHPQDSSQMIIRQGKSYYLNGVDLAEGYSVYMEGSPYAEFLKTRCQPAYQSLEVGRKVCVAGVLCFTAGVIFQIPLCVVLAKWAAKGNTDWIRTKVRPEGMSDAEYNTPYVAMAGAAVAVVGVPLTCIGVHKVHKSATIYNTAGKASVIQPQLGVQVVPNGLGLSMTF